MTATAATAEQITEWKARFLASFDDGRPSPYSAEEVAGEAAFWRDELADPRAARFWYDHDTSAKQT